MTIAAMQWPSAQILAQIHAKILADQFGCDVRVMAGDMAASAASMQAQGEPAIAPELWLSRIADIWNQASKAQAVRQAGLTYAETNLEGWFIPDYVAEAHPELTTPAALQAGWEIFANGRAKARFVSCPPDWACAVINRNLLKAYGLDQLFDVVEPANRFEMDTLISEAESRKQPLLFYYWQPNSVLAQFGFKALDLGAYDHDALVCLAQRSCAEPKPSSFYPEPVVVGAAEWVFTDTPEIAAYLQRARMPIAEMNALLLKLSAPGATPESVAAEFVATREEVWRGWVGTPMTAAGE
jgi:glycine betaine/proline transport system substrate-binding protein